MKTHFYDLSTRVLIYKEGGQFVAHALEFDIVAYADTEEEVKKALEGLLENQVSFASCMENAEMVHFPAPKEFFERWETANQARLRGERLSEKSLALSGKPLVFVYSEDELNKLRASRKRDFSRSENDLALA